MTTIHNRSPISVAWETTAGNYYFNLSDQLAAPLRIQYNTPKSLHRTIVSIQTSITTTVHRGLPNNNLHIVHFKTT